MRTPIKKATFVGSFTDLAQCPEPNLPEYAFIGRSNVGKSSLINALTDHKSLAKTSSTPGKTQTINHFIIDDAWYLVDLPGYGYAKQQRTKVLQWQSFTATYLQKRENLVCVFVLLDSRLEPQKSDIEMMNWLGAAHIPFVMVFTKLDKMSSAAYNKNLTAYRKYMLQHWEDLPEVFGTSSEVFHGLLPLYQYIMQQNGVFQTYKKKIAK